MNLWMQMSTYYAPAFFAHLLGRCFQCRSPVVGVMRLGVMVLATFAVCWWPFLSSWQSVLQVEPLVFYQNDLLCIQKFILHLHGNEVWLPEWVWVFTAGIVSVSPLGARSLWGLCGQFLVQHIITDKMETAFFHSNVSTPCYGHDNRSIPAIHGAADFGSKCWRLPLLNAQQFFCFLPVCISRSAMVCPTVKCSWDNHWTSLNVSLTMTKQ